MTARFLILIVISALLVGLPESYCQSTPDSLFISFPDRAALPTKFAGNISRLKEAAGELFNDGGASVRDAPDSVMLQAIDQATNFQNLLLAKYWLAWHYREMIPVLILKMRNKKFVGLSNYADMVIWERVRSGHMKYYGNGNVEADDLFTVAGRVNWLLKQVTGEQFGNVSMYSDNRQLRKLQQKWIQWLQSLTEKK